ncbi:MAG: hypothetical protein HW421_550 [Ignavibacteria bacterium]|nr:hypothetical protein [Ignavibacteria bacterium]
MQNIIIKPALAALCGLILFFFSALASTFNANPNDYLIQLSKLSPGDTLLLLPGNYTRGLKINNLHGKNNAWFVIKSAEKHKAVILGRSGVNTTDIINSEYVKIEGMKYDGTNLEVDAIKASGSAKDSVNNIWLEGNLIVGHGTNQQICGISTKVYARDWTIRNNEIIEAGTGIYLGNSDGSMPFIGGKIEFNLVLNPVGYCMQIKHQNPSDTFDINKPVTSTVVRHNVFAKDSRPSPDGDRPNVLFGGFQSGTGGDMYRVEFYGNFLYQNPREYLMQATGNISIHNNLFAGSSVGAINLQLHNSRQPREVFIYNNSIWGHGKGISLSGQDKNYSQNSAGNAIFTNTPLSGFKDSSSITGNFASAVNYFSNPDTLINLLDFYPLTGSGKANLDYTSFKKDLDYNYDFNLNKQEGKYFGAYSGEGKNPGWKPALQIKEINNSNFITDDFNGYEKGQFNLKIFPNPASAALKLEFTNPIADIITIRVFDLLSKKSNIIFQKFLLAGENCIDLNLSDLFCSNLYFVQLCNSRDCEVKTLFILN